MDTPWTIEHVIQSSKPVWYVCLNNSFQFFWKYVRMKKYVEMCVTLFKNWKYVFKMMYQTAPSLQIPFFVF